MEITSENIASLDFIENGRVNFGTWNNIENHKEYANWLFKKLGYKKGSCKNAEFVCKHIVNFPTHLKIDFKYFKKILSMNKTYIKNNVRNE